MADWIAGNSPTVVRANVNKFNAKFLHIEDYGAVHNGSDDDTVAIQNAILAAIALGGADIYCPNGIYKIAGALQTSIGGQNPNCQIYIPADAFTAARCTIRFIGQSSYPCPINGAVGAAGVISTTGVIFYSTLASASGTNPSVFGSNGGAGVSSFHNVVFENIALRLKSGANGPVLTGVNWEHMAYGNFENFSVTLDVVQQNSNNPTNECAGIIMGRYGNISCTAKNVTIQGFKYGLIPAEHAFLSNVLIFGCYYGMALPFGYYMYNGSIVTIHWCKTSIYSPQSALMGLTYGNCNFNISALEFEVITGTGLWYDYGTTIVDVGNQIYGKARYIMCNANVGTDYTKFSKTGATNLTLERSDNG
jgi:hypothetical protein